MQLRAFSSPSSTASSPNASLPNASLAFESSDGGVTWNMLALIATRNATLTAKGWEGPGENDLARLADGSLIAVFRVRSCEPYWRRDEL